MPKKTFPQPQQTHADKPDRSKHKHPPELEELMKFLRVYGWPVAAGIGLALAAFLGYTSYVHYQHGTEKRAMELLTRATTTEDMEHILRNYEDSQAAPMALLSLASTQFRNAQYPQAYDAYTRFLETYPDHEMIPEAKIGAAYCLEALNRPDQAHLAFTAFMENFPDHYLSETALFGSARTLSLQGQYEEAIAIYEQFIEENPDSPWLPQAETARIYTEKNKRAAQQNVPADMNRDDITTPLP